MKYTALTSTIIALLVMVSCHNTKPLTSKSAINLYETFYVGEEGTQYYIKPLEWKNDKNDPINVDITFRYKKEINDTATINLSIVNEKLIKQVDSVIFKTDNQQFNITRLAYMFCDRKKDDFLCRFSSELHLSKVQQLFAAGQWNILLYTDGTSEKYEPTNSTRRKVGKLNKEIFVIL
jgi:hypothetical protein